jgi:thiol:disulfide interchange protein DsbD
MRRAPADWRCRIAVLAASIAMTAAAAAAGLPSGEPKLLPPEEVFRFSARVLDPRTLEARFEVMEGYYLYRDKLAFTEQPDVGAGKPELPQGQRHHDEFFGDVETYRGRVVVKVPLAAARPGQQLTVRAESQGCADAGICYPPTVQEVKVKVPAAGAGPGPVVDAPRKKGLFD